MTADPHLEERVTLCEQAVTLLTETVKASKVRNDLVNTYVSVSALQFLSNLKAAIILLREGYDSEAIIIARSMSEIVIRAAWVRVRKSNAGWIIVGEKYDALERLKMRKRFKGKAEMRRMLERQITEVLAAAPKNSRFISKKPRLLMKKLPSAAKMAKEAKLSVIYNGWFSWGSEHTHIRQGILERYIAFDPDGNISHLAADGTYSEISRVSNTLVMIACFFISMLSKQGLNVDYQALKRIYIRAMAITPTNDINPHQLRKEQA